MKSETTKTVLRRLTMRCPACSRSRRLVDPGADTAGRADIARRTLNGTVKALGSRLEAVAEAAAAQEHAARVLAGDARDAYRDAVARILEATRDGALLRGEVLARWQDFVGTGEFFRAMEQNIGRFRDRTGAFFRGEPTPAVRVETAIETGLQAVIIDEAANAGEDAPRRGIDPFGGISGKQVG